jgi:hypothetical protein
MDWDDESCAVLADLAPGYPWIPTLFQETAMTSKTSFLKDNRLVVIGRRFGSDAVALEAAEASARWGRDEVALAPYGFGASVRARYEEDRNQQETLRVSRSQAVASKKLSYAARDQHVSRGWAWVDRVSSALGVLGLTDEGLATEAAAAKPEDDAGLVAGIQALAKILAGAKDRLPADAQVDQRLAEAEGLAAEIESSPGSVHTSSGQTVADTAQIDLLDGKLYLWIRELNKAGRRAIRNGHLPGAPLDYAFHHLKHSGKATLLQPVPPTPTATASP